MWRPGGSIDRPAEDANDDWGSSGTSTATRQQDTYSSSITDSDNGWGKSSNEQSRSTWTPSSTNDGQQSNDRKNAKIETSDERADISSYGASINTAAMGDADGEEAPVWFMERVCVELKKDKSSAVIKETNNNTAVIELEDKSTATIHAGECTMVPPKEHDTVLVTGGADVGVEGELICIDGTDAILKDSNNEDFKIVDLVHLAKIVVESN